MPNRKVNLKAFSNDIKNLAFEIGINIQKEKKRPNIKFSILISRNFQVFLQNNYDINFSRYKRNQSLLKDLKLPTVNFYNESDLFSIEKDSFEIKLMKEK